MDTPPPTQGVGLQVGANAIAAPPLGLPVQNIGLPAGLAASAVPPLGVGLAPSIGRGGDGDQTAEPMQVGGWTSGPGAVAIYGRQWVTPFQVAPGSTVQNVSCDVWNPNATAGVTDTMELLGSAGVIASVSIPASTAVVIRAWLSPLSYLVPDGGPLLLRHSTKTSAGVWTSSSQLVTVISCAVNARRQHTYKLSPLVGANVGAGAFQVVASGALSGNWAPVNDGDLLGLQLLVQDGERFDRVSSSIYGNSAYTITMTVLAQDDAFHAGAQLGNAPTSAAQNSTQTLTVFPLANDNSGNNEQVTTTQRSYHLQFRARRVAALDGGQPFIGPITLVTSSPN